MNRRLTRAGNRFGVWMYRRLDGRFAAGRSGATVLIVTVAGRRTGLPRSVCVRYLVHGDEWIVWGTGSGSAHDPDWFSNLRRAEAATIQIGSTTRRVVPHELAEPDRDRVWRDEILARAPEVEKFARKAGRRIPVAVLTPHSGP